MPGPKLKNPRFLDNPLRKLILQPERLFDDIGTKPAEIWADIGCGTGFFALPLAGRVKKVYALDINPQMLEQLE